MNQINKYLEKAPPLLYMVSVLWSAYLILVSYRQTADIVTALATVSVILLSMIFNDLLDKKKN